MIPASRCRFTSFLTVSRMLALTEFTRALPLNGDVRLILQLRSAGTLVGIVVSFASVSSQRCLNLKIMRLQSSSSSDDRCFPKVIADSGPSVSAKAALVFPSQGIIPSEQGIIVK